MPETAGAAVRLVAASAAFFFFLFCAFQRQHVARIRRKRTAKLPNTALLVMNLYAANKTRIASLAGLPGG